MPPFIATSTFKSAVTEVLAIHCSDYRIQGGVREFLDHGLNLGADYDLMVIPGGPQFLTAAEHMPNLLWAGERWFRFLVEMHRLKRLILIAHQDCAWYNGLPLHLHTSSILRERQEEDLRRAHRLLQENFPQLRVEFYYAGWDNGNHVVIEPISG